MATKGRVALSLMAMAFLASGTAAAQWLPDPMASVRDPTPAIPTVPGHQFAMPPLLEAPNPMMADQLVALVTGVTPDVEKLLALPEDDIDIGRAALLISKAVFPAIDVERYDAEIQRLADAVKGRANDSRNAETLLRALHRVIYEEEGFRYDHAPDARGNIGNFHLFTLLERKQGLCVPLTTLVLAVAQRAGLRAYPVAAPQHVFVRVMSSRLRTIGFETTSGTISSDAYYVERFKIADKGIKSGAYLRTESYREFLAHLLHQNAFAIRRAPVFDKATRDASIAWFEKAVAINPYAVGSIETLRWAYEYERMESSRLRDMTLAATYNQKALLAYRKTEELGLQGEPAE